MNCLHCNKPIQGRRNTKKYCNSTCKQYAYLNRNFAIPSNLKSSILNAEELKNVQQEKQVGAIISKNENNDNKNINFKPINSHENREQVTQENYQEIYPEILERIQMGQVSLKISSSYFTRNRNNGGRITDYNFSAFSYMMPRIRCIIENLFQLSYKRKLYFRTAITICKAVEEILMSDHVKLMPTDFPFFDDLLKLYEQLNSIALYLKEDKEGTKFLLSKTAIVRYIMILTLIRDFAKKEPFHKLFPELLKTKAV